ncbi:hypothetical protein [Jannaschia sp. W003]|uniref:hypothetical protein n=1 Tax=Jannaschia sp. W003 TaxID=2867012 RepID=UPI0021A95550|nr:hypothetical protein [Jannaschia sp. W003]UWQ22523.1 hypothetical protein K3554_05725 [Jannaschia sp. W003]
MTRPAPRWLPILAALLTGAVLFAVGRVHGAGLFAEGGVVEAATAGLLAAAGSAALVLRRPWAGTALVLLALRELDLDKRAVSEGILKLRQYSGDAPLGEKIAGLLVIALILAILWRFARALPSVLRAARRETWARLVLLAFALVVVAKTLDGLARKLAGIGVEISAEAAARAPAFEESLELLFGACLLWAVLAYRTSPCPPSNPPA